MWPDFQPTYLRLSQEQDIVVAGFRHSSLTEELNIEQLGHELFSLVDQYDLDRLVVDMDGVDYLTSSVLGKLITLHRRLHRKGGRLALCRPTTPVAEIMRTSRLIDYFTLCDTLPAAIAALK